MSAQPLRVVFLVSTLRRAGPTSQLLNILRHVERDRIEPAVVTISPEPADSMLDQFQSLGMPIHTLGLSRLRAFARRGWRRDIGQLTGAPLDDRCVLHSQGIRADLIASRWLAGLHRVATARNYPYDDYPLKFGRLPGLWMARSHVRAFQRLPNVIACSSTLAGQLRGHGIEAGVIRNGVDTERFRPASAAERARLRASLSLPPGACIGVSVGALSARKDPALIVRALRAVVDPRLAIVFVGDGPLEAECRHAAHGDGRVRFAGQVADVTPFLRAADFFVSASHAAGLPNGVLEAMACGLHLVLTDIGPHRELLEMAPASGEAVPIGDEGAFAAAIERVRISGHAPPDAGLVERLGAERMSMSYQDLYRHLANNQ